MSLTSGFFNSLNHDRTYDAIQFSSIFDGIIKDGVFDSIGNCFMVRPNGGMEVIVEPGKAWFNHTWTYNDASLILRGFDTPNAVLNRIDGIFLKVDHSIDVRSNSFVIVRGDDSSTPQRPHPANTDTIFYHPIAYIDIPASSTEIVQARITPVVGTAECPYISGILEVATIDNISAGLQDMFRRWFAELKHGLEPEDYQLSPQLKQEIDSKNSFNNIYVSADGWYHELTTINDTDYYTKTIPMVHVHDEHPIVAIGCDVTRGFPTIEEQDAFDLVGFVTANKRYNSLTIYVTDIPVSGFYMLVRGCE